MTDMQLRTMAAHPDRVDLKIIAGFVTPGARVLDVGCGDGALLERLEQEKQVDGRGIELSQKGVNEAVARGLSVVQGDADHDLATYPDAAFDFVILSQTLQATYNPRTVLEELLRIGRKVVVSFPNFGNWRVRREFVVKGRMPITENLPYSWYDTPNIHFCTVRDFVALTEEIDAQIEKAVALWGKDRVLNRSIRLTLWNFLADQAIFLLSRR
ncbi:MAG TPA: methionine biosynthesis protein MetW [Propylenella sp.]